MGARRGRRGLRPDGGFRGAAGPRSACCPPLEQVLDAVTSVSVAVEHGASVPSSGVRQLCAALHAVSEAASSGTPLPAHLELPDDKTLEPITEAVRALLGVLASGERLTSPG